MGVGDDNPAFVKINPNHLATKTIHSNDVPLFVSFGHADVK